MTGRRRLITMARRRHTPEQIIRKLREADRLLGEGAEIADQRIREGLDVLEAAAYVRPPHDEHRALEAMSASRFLLDAPNQPGTTPTRHDAYPAPKCLIAHRVRHGFRAATTTDQPPPGHDPGTACRGAVH